MSNPLDSVTRTVNSLLTALKMPDASSEANDVLGQMRFPQFSRVLPYRDYDAETGLFMNEKTMGFMLEAQPINGANETIVSSLENLMRTLRRYNLARPVGRLSGLDSRIEVFPTVLLALPDADLADAAAESARTRTELGLYERPEGADTEAGEGEA